MWNSPIFTWKHDFPILILEDARKKIKIFFEQIVRNFLEKMQNRVGSSKKSIGSKKSLFVAKLHALQYFRKVLKTKICEFHILVPN